MKRREAASFCALLKVLIQLYKLCAKICWQNNPQKFFCYFPFLSNRTGFLNSNVNVSFRHVFSWLHFLRRQKSSHNESCNCGYFISFKLNFRWLDVILISVWPTECNFIFTNVCAFPTKSCHLSPSQVSLSLSDIRILIQWKDVFSLLHFTEQLVRERSSL